MYTCDPWVHSGIDGLKAATRLLHAPDFYPWLNTNFQSNCQAVADTPSPPTWIRRASPRPPHTPQPQHAVRLTPGYKFVASGMLQPTEPDVASQQVDKSAGGIQDVARTEKVNLVYSGSDSQKAALFSPKDTIAPLPSTHSPWALKEKGFISSRSVACRNPRCSPEVSHYVSS